VGKPNERERDLYSFRKVHISSNNTIPGKINPLIAHKNWPHKIFPWKTCQIHTIVWPTQKSAPWKVCPQYFVRPNMYGPVAARKTLQNSLENHATLASIFVLSFPCCMDPYSTTSNSSNKYSTLTQKYSLGICPQSLFGKVPSLLP
jgi:hypothetical protein